jgi:hypothetical protein
MPTLGQYTLAQLKAAIDTGITNKTAPNSILPTDDGALRKLVLEDLFIKIYAATPVSSVNYSDTEPVTAGIEGDVTIVTDDGTDAGTVLSVWIFGGAVWTETTIGDLQNLSSYVLKSTTINSKPLSSNIVISASDIGLGNVTNHAQLKASDLDTDGTFAANSDTKIPSQKAVNTAVTAARAYADSLVIGLLERT